MADFDKAIPKLIKAEGGYKTIHISADRGGLTYAGVSSRSWPKWPYWGAPDNSRDKQRAARGLYRKHYWDKIGGDHIKSQDVAESLFFWVVVAGLRTPVKTLQRIVGATPDGIMGPQTLGHMSDFSNRLLELELFAAKIRRRMDIARDPSQRKFLRGWISRALEQV